MDEEKETQTTAAVRQPDSSAPEHESRAIPDPDATPAPALHISTILGPLPAGVSAKQTRDLNDAVHQILVIGLAVSSMLLIVGLLLAVAAGQQLPEATQSIGQALAGVLSLQPAGFLSLGLLALMFTPIVRVVGSVIVFIWERDHRYTVVTLVVLVVMTVSVLVGRG